MIAHCYTQPAPGESTAFGNVPTFTSPRPLPRDRIPPVVTCATVAVSFPVLLSPGLLVGAFLCAQ